MQHSIGEKGASSKILAKNRAARFHTISGLAATPEMIHQCVRLDGAIFDPTTCATLDQCLEWWRYNPEIYLLTVDSSTNSVIGYLNHMAITDKVAEDLLVGKLIDPQIGCTDISLLEIPGLYRLFLCSLVVAQEFRLTNVLRVLYEAFLERVYCLALADIYFSDFIADAFTVQGRQLCSHVGMDPICVSAHGSTVFHMPMLPPKLVPVTPCQRRIYSRYKKKADELLRFTGGPISIRQPPEGQNTTLESLLNELDSRAARVELGLRQLIAATLQEDERQLPSHLHQRLRDRISTDARCCALHLDEYKPLRKQLEFCDLRELEDIIKNSALWSKFEGHFMNKDTLASRFGQLAAIRNGIRHIRTVDDIVLKEGEAAIMWFERVLKRIPAHV